MQTTIKIKGAREHNHKNLELLIPRDAITVITGPSGSGKSSLAIDTIYAEGQRRYVESLSPYSRQFLVQMQKPDVDSIEGLSPSVATDQRTVSRSPRSTLGTITEIYDYLRQRTITLSDELRESTDAREAHRAVKLELGESLESIRRDIVCKESALREQETHLKELRRSLDVHRSAVHDLTLRITENNLTISHLLSDIEGKYHLRLDALSPDQAPAESIDAAQTTSLLNELREKLERLGEVNLAAAQEEDELTTRHQFLTEQREDLTKALESLNQAIKKINRTTRQRFLETFHAVNEQFTKVFPELFQGGRAELKLTDEDNILETGVDIVAQAPGKKLQGLELKFRFSE